MGKNTKSVSGGAARTISCVFAICLFMAMPRVTAQENKSFIVKGVVTDVSGTPQENVLVDLKESLSFTLTDAQGNFSITVPNERASLIFTKEEYKVATVSVGNVRTVNVTLLVDDSIDDPMITLIYGKQRKSLITSAISTIYGSDVEEKPTQFQNTALAGMLPGLAVELASGAPGGDVSTLNVRGYRSWRHTSPMLLLDGYVRDFSAIDPHEIDQISVYKDAGALSVLGLRSSNGAIGVTTKRGKEGRPVLKFNSQFSFQQPTKLPNFLDSWHYAQLHNEARINDGNPPLYNDNDLELYLSGAEPYSHPNVDWLDETLKSSTFSQRYNLSIEGGSSVAKYYVNVSYLDNNGIYNTEKSINAYNTNASSKMYTIRSNIDIALTKTMDLSMNLYGRQRVWNKPGSGSDVFSTIYSFPSNKFPYNFGLDKPAGGRDNTINPFGVLNHSGYSQSDHNTMEASAEIRQRLDFVTKGLAVFGSFAFDARFSNEINRSKAYKIYEYQSMDPETGEPVLISYGNIKTQNNANAFGASKVRNFDIRAGANYDRAFGDHNVSAMAFFEYLNQSTDTQNLPNLHQGVFGRATYHYDSRYIAEFSFGWQGTEQMPSHNRYGFFPAASVGWIISNERFIKESAVGSVINFAKIRGSYGLTGNEGNIPYYYYLPAFQKTSSSYNFGTSMSNVSTWAENTAHQYNMNTIWENTLKKDVGIDLTLFNRHLSLSFDYFEEETSRILNPLSSVSTLYGFGVTAAPAAFIGETANRGFEAQAVISGNIKDFNWSLGGIGSFWRSEITLMDEQPFEHAYRYQKGDPLYSLYGYVTDGLYTSEQDRLNSPSTSFGNSFAGDIKYRDLNGDGKITVQDMDRIGQSGLGEVNYSFFGNASYKGFDFHIMFSGASGRDLNFGRGVVTHAFYNTSGSGGTYEGNVTQYHWDNRYNPRDESTWESAEYPRLTLLGSAHNYDQTTSFFLKDASYLRLKSLVVGYTIPRKYTQKLKMSKLRVAYSGYNLYTWDKMGSDLDPETGRGYPTMKTSSISLTLHF